MAIFFKQPAKSTCGIAESLLIIFTHTNDLAHFNILVEQYYYRVATNLPVSSLIPGSAVPPRTPSSHHTQCAYRTATNVQYGVVGRS